ncbi:MAG: hypothetical protein ACLFV6_13795 [Spirulinaceae cyanobacterium]
MSFNPLTEKGIPLDQQLRNWSELNIQPYNKQDVHPYTRTRIITMNGVEIESIFFSHQFARHTSDPDIRKYLAQTRRIEQQQQKAINWLSPGDESPLETTIGYEQVAVDLTAYLARVEPNPYLKQAFEFGLLEDFDHLYRYANLLDLLNGKKAEKLTGDLTEIMPGRATADEHRHPIDEVRQPSDSKKADPFSILHTMTLVAAEQQTMNFYMTVGNQPMHPLARGLYLEIAQIEEQHVTHYESLLDPTISWFQRDVLHQYNECYLYYSFMQQEPDPRIKQLWELHLNMEIEQLRLACEMLRKYDGKEPEEFLPSSISEPVKFQENKDYIRQVLKDQVNLTGDEIKFIPVSDLPENHRYFQYQETANKGGVPSQQVIEQHQQQMGNDYTMTTEGKPPLVGV